MRVVTYQKQNGQRLWNKTISRATAFNIEGLSSNTRYTVGIQTLDGSSQTSRIIYKDFKTKEITGKPLNNIRINGTRVGNRCAFSIRFSSCRPSFWFGLDELGKQLSVNIIAAAEI